MARTVFKPMTILKQLFVIWFALAFSCSMAQAQQAAPSSMAADRAEAINHLITVLDDPELRSNLLNFLRAEVGNTTDNVASTDPATDGVTVEEQATEEQPGLVDALFTWSQLFIAKLPTTTFGVPLDQKANQAAVQLGSRLQSGIDTGQLQGFAVWAVPGLAILIGGCLLVRRLWRKLTAPSIPVRRRRLAAGLLLQLVAHIGLFLFVIVGAALIAPTGAAIQIFATLAIAILLAMLGANLLLASLSALAGWRGTRLVRYCQVRFYPWLLAISFVVVFAALGNEPSLRRILGWSAADIGGFTLNLVAAAIFLAFIARQKLAITRIAFGRTSTQSLSEGALQIAMRRLSKHWHLLAYGFLLLSVASVVGGQRENDVLSQMLWSFGVVLMGLVTITILNRLFVPRLPRYQYRVSPVQRVVVSALLRVLRIALDAIVVFGIILSLGLIWGFNIWRWLTAEGLPFTGPLLAAATVVSVAWLIWVALDAWIATMLSAGGDHNWSQRRSNRVQTLLPLIRNGAMILLIVLTGIAVLANIGIDVTPLIAGAGVFGLAISFGSQQLVQDIITGIFILAEDTIAIGDTINTGDRSGVVESISLRTIRLRDGDGALHSIPFSTVKALKNSSRNFGILRPRYTVPSSIDPHVIMDEMRLAAKALRENPRYSGSITTDLQDLGIDEINAGSVVVSGSMRTSPLRQNELARAFNGKLLEGLAAKGIVI